jgi:hypothetical protein
MKYLLLSAATFILILLALLALGQALAAPLSPTSIKSSTITAGQPNPPENKASTVHLVVTEFCPLFCFKNNLHKGLESLLKEIYAEQGIEAVFYTLPMARTFKEVIEGNYDAIINPTHPALLSLNRTNKSLYDMKVCSYTHNNTTWNKDADPNMTSLKFGLVKDYDYTSYSARLAANISLASRENRVEYIVPFSQPDIRNFRKLLAERIDVTVTSHAVAKYLVNHNQWQGRIKNIGCFDGLLPTYIWFTPARPHTDYYQKLFDQNIDRYKHQEFYKDFIRTYRDESQT